MKRLLPLALGLIGVGAYAHCYETAGQHHRIDPLLLAAIADVESGRRTDALNLYPDGSRDVGLMQINSYHFPRLAREGITEARLREDACLNVEVAAGILRGFINRYGYNWTAVGAYNAGTAKAREGRRIAYARKVWKQYRRLSHNAAR